MRSRLARGLAATAIIAASGISPVIAHAQAPISGRIINGTSGGSVPSEMTVTAAYLKDDGTEVKRGQIRTNPDGSFALDRTESEQVVLGTDYLGITYSTTVPTETDSVELRIFEVTREASGVSVVSDTMTIVSGPNNVLEVLQLMRFQNSGDRTYIGRETTGNPSVLELPTAQGAFDLAPGQGITARNLELVAGGFTTGDPLLPGVSSINYLYKVKVARSGWPLVRQVFYPTDHIDVLIGPGLNVGGSGLQFQESVDLAGRTYRRYRSGTRLAGDAFEAQITFSGGTTEGLAVVGVGGVALLILLAIIVPQFIRRRSSSGPTMSQREALVLEIASLDEDFDAGKISTQHYENHRRQLKKQLEDIASRISS